MVYNKFGVCKDCKRNMMLREGRCGTCWKKRESRGIVESSKDGDVLEVAL